MFTIPLAIYLTLCVVVGLWGRSARMGFVGSFLLSVFVTPFIVFIAMLLFMPRRDERSVPRR